MSFITAALIVGGAAVVGGVVAAQGAKSAASTQAGAALTAADLSKQEFDITQAQQQPFMGAGYGAQGQLDYLLGIGPNPNITPQGGAPGGGGGAPWTGQLGGGGASGPGARVMAGGAGMGGADFGAQPFGGRPNMMSPSLTYPGSSTTNTGTAGTGTGPMASSSVAGGYGSLLSPFTLDTFHKMSPGYQFQLQQGQQGVLNADASGAGALSGAAQKDLIGFNQGFAQDAWNNAFNQYQVQQGNIFSRLSDVANRGQNAAANAGQTGANLTGQVAQSISNAGSASAAGQIGAANAYSGALSNAALPWLMKTMPT